MLSLVMDTSNQYLLVALFENGELLDSIIELGSKRQSENAIPYLEKLLTKHNKELLDVKEVVITKGPGSYTGVRVAMAIAKTLSVISPIKLKTVSSLAIYANEGKCVSVLDARSKKVFVCAYDNNKAVSEEQLVAIADFDSFMESYQGYSVVGQSELVGHPQVEVDLARNMYRLSLNEECVEHIDALVPCYIKDVEAKKICL